MKLKNLTKSVSIILMLLAMLFSCQPVNDDGGSNNSGNNTTQEGGNNNDENNNDGNNSGNENSGNNQGGENNGNTEKPALKVTITFNTNGINETAPTTIETTSDKSVDLPALTNAKFSHWNTKADGSGLSYSGSVIFAESVTLYAIQLAENEFKITYVLDGGINNSANPFSFTEEDFIGLKNPSKDGYTFVGWYENRDFSGNSIKGWAAGDKTADVIIYAKWEKESEPAVKVTITFNTNGINETTPTAIETTSDKSVDLPTLTNAKFSHWNTKADGSGLSYSGSVIFAESVTLYAIQLAENEFKITYVLDGGVNNPKNKYTFTEDEYVALRDPTKDGYIFLGWYETADFSGDAIKLWFDGDKTADVTLYAKWIKGYKITYVLNGGVNSPNNPSFYTEDESWVTVEEATKDGYIFAGWYETEDFSSEKITQFYNFAERKADVTLYAKWIELEPGSIFLSGLNGVNWAGSESVGSADAMTKGENDAWTFTFTAESTMPFPYGFKFTTENGWLEQYQAYNKENPTTDFTILEADKEAEVYFATNDEIEAEDDNGNRISDSATKFSLGLNCFIVDNEYTITFDKANMKIKISGEFVAVSISSISIISYPEKTSYIVGEELNLNWLGVETTYSDGSTSYVNVTSDMVSGFDSSVVGIQTLTITYGGCTTTFDVEVVELKNTYIITYVLDGGVNSPNNPSFYTEDESWVTVEEATKDGYIFAGWYETEDFSSEKITQFYNFAERKADVTLYAKWIELEPGSIFLSGLNGVNWAGSESVGSADAMTKGENDAWTFTFTAESTMPFPYGFKFTTENGWLEQYQAYNKENPTTDFTILEADKEAEVYFATNDEIEAEDDNGNRISDSATKFSLGLNCFIVDNEYTITFDKANMKIKISGEFVLISVSSISITSYPDKASYFVGEELDLTGLAVEAYYSDDSTSSVEVTLDMVSGFDSSVPGAQTLTVTYDGCTTTFEVNVTEPTVSSISITSYPDKTSYFVGDELDLTGLAVEAYYSDDSTSSVEVTLDMVSGFDSSVPGVQTLTVTYSDCTATFDVEVVE